MEGLESRKYYRQLQKQGAEIVQKGTFGDIRTVITPIIIGVGPTSLVYALHYRYSFAESLQYT